MLVNKLNFFILTGGPGSGKSAIIEQLKAQGYICCEEVGRQIIQEQLAMGGNALHWGDRLKFRDLMFARSIEDYARLQNETGFVLFDRGIPDLIGYCHLINEPVPDEYWNAVKAYRYNPLVFIAPPWQEIYVNDKERKQDFQEAIDTYESIKKGYLACGYQVAELPKSSIEDRVQFILSHQKLSST